MSEQYLTHTFPNGLTLLAEKMKGVSSAAMTVLVPAGAANDPADRVGTANVLGDLVFRGAGHRDSRELTNHLDRLGLQRGGGVGVNHTRFSAAAVADKVIQGLEAHADILRQPHLPEDGFEASRSLALQGLAGIEDEPQRKAMIELRRWLWPAPYGRNAMGEVPDLEQMTIDVARLEHARRYDPRGTILAIAGDIDILQVHAEVERLFADWQPQSPPAIRLIPPPGRRHFIEHQSEQTHIGLAWPATPESSDDYYVARLANEILGGSTSGRMFTEVREKRALCYSVSAGYAGMNTSAGALGAVLAYSGTSNERAQATLDQMLTEARRMSEGVSEDELNRAKVGLKAATIMSGESTSSRAGSIAYDWFARGKIRTLDEIKDAINAVTLDRINTYLQANPPGPFTCVIVGPKDLKLDGVV